MGVNNANKIRAVAGWGKYSGQYEKNQVGWHLNFNGSGLKSLGDVSEPQFPHPEKRDNPIRHTELLGGPIGASCKVLAVARKSLRCTKIGQGPTHPHRQCLAMPVVWHSESVLRPDTNSFCHRLCPYLYVLASLGLLYFTCLASKEP